MTASRAQLPPLPRTIRSLTDADHHTLNERLPASRITVRNCITCHGSRTFRWLDADRQPVDYDCPCEDQYRLARTLFHSGILLNYQRLGWLDFDHIDPEVFAPVDKYLAQHRSLTSAGFGMVIHGTRGNGKSLLAYLLVKGLIERGHKCFAAPFADLIEAFSGGWRDPARERWFNQAVRNTGVLFIDDLGREYRLAQQVKDAVLTDEERRERAQADNRVGSMRETLLESMVRHRVGSALPTIITTNLTPDQVMSGYGGHTMSLLGERSIFMEVSGPDRRPEINRRETGYALEGLTRPVVLG